MLASGRPLFTPIFGGKPDFFFGREDIIKRFDAAMKDRGSDYRALFLTGTRGYGKTSVLEQLSQRAGKAGWKVVDIGSDAPVETVVNRLAGATEMTKTIDPSIDVSVLGIGASAGGVSTAKMTRFSRADLGALVLEACEREKHGLFLTIDEIQKIDLDDVAAICDAFQMASRKGFEVMLAIAGLPYAHSRVIQHEGCTYLRRGVHEVLAPLLPDEVRGAFKDAFASIKGLSVGKDAFDDLVSSSKGHPYIMQLLGYYLIEDANAKAGKGAGRITRADAGRTIERALDAYATRAVAPIVDAMSDGEADYLRAMSQVIGIDRIAKTGDIANALGKTQQQVSRSRQYLIDNGIIIVARRGEVAFGIPYLDDYLLNRADDNRELRLREVWGY